MAKLIVGYGYLGSRVGARWLGAGNTVFAVTRTKSRAAELQHQGLTPIVADVTIRESLHQLPSVDTVLYAVGYDRTSTQSIEEVYAGGLQNVLDALPSTANRVIYISSTGVYGDCAGQWINEDTPARPVRPGGRASLAAELVLHNHTLGSRGVILRLAGIYGPGRIPRAAMLLAGEAIPAPSEGYLNLIHIDDAVSVVLAAEQLEQLPRMYVVSDGNPVVRRDYYAELARLLAAPAPTFTSAPDDSPATQRAAADKRINPARMMAELRPQLSFPSFREGLAAIIRSHAQQ